MSIQSSDCSPYYTAIMSIIGSRDSFGHTNVGNVDGRWNVLDCCEGYVICSLSRLVPSSCPSYVPHLVQTSVPSFDPSCVCGLIPSFDQSATKSSVPSLYSSALCRFVPSFNSCVVPSPVPSLVPGSGSGKSHKG